MGSKWEEAKAERAERRARNSLVQARRRGHAAQKQQALLEKLAEQGDANAQRELKRRADINRPHSSDEERTG